MIDHLLSHPPYLVVVAVVALGIYAMIANSDYFRALVGLILLQSGIILFYIILAVRTEGTIPILSEGHAPLPMPHRIHNPLPHALMLTAIVVGVATVGVAMAILRRLGAEEGSIDETAAQGPGAKAGGGQK